MGGGVSKTTLVSKAQAVSAVRAAFDGKPGEATVPLEALVHAALPASAPKAARKASAADAYRTTADEMHQWHREPSVAKKLGVKVQGGSDHLAWKAALESGTLTRDARMTKVTSAPRENRPALSRSRALSLPAATAAPAIDANTFSQYLWCDNTRSR